MIPVLPDLNSQGTPAVPTNTKSLPATLRVCLSAAALTVALSACGSTKWGFPYRADIQQGNWITAAQVARLERGMSRAQVRFVLGTPVLQDVMHADRWDYTYYNQPGYGDRELRQLTVWFEGDALARWEGDAQPDRQPFERTDTGAVQNGKDEAAEPAARTTAQEQAAPPNQTPSSP
jgi:outer membrane protein assembly factor BamE